MNRELLKKGLDLYNIVCDEAMLERFQIYMDMLIEWNKKINLTAITEEDEIITKHFLDSISCMEAGEPFNEKNVIDVGTGAGFPGIPLKIVNESMDLTLLDSLNKRIIFLSELMEKMGLKCRVVHGRAEDYGVKNDFREKFDIVLSRAVANMSVLSEYTIPFAKVGGYVLCQKGPGVFDEIKEAENAIDVLGGKTEQILSTKVYNSDFSHYISIVKKVKSTPMKYPRKAGMVEKNPLK